MQKTDVFSRTRSKCRQRGRLLQDFATLDLEDFRHNFVNITGLRLVDDEDPVIRDTLHQMRLHQHHTGTKLLNNSKQLIIKVCWLSFFIILYAYVSSLSLR